MTRTTILGFILSYFVFFQSCAPTLHDLEQEMEKIYTDQKVSVEKSREDQTTKAVALVCHGLNTKPEKMRSLTQYLNTQNIETHLVALTGHRGNLNKTEEASAAVWLVDLHKAYGQAKNRSQQLKKPLIYIGYSLGDVLNTVMMMIKKEVQYDKMILFAPALALRPSSYLVRFFKIFGKKFIVPSFSPKIYRANPGISVAAYDALFDLMSLSDKKKYQDIKIPVLIFIDPKDELVSMRSLKQIKKKYKLSEWDIISISKKEASLATNYHHLIIDEESLGKETWDEVKREIKKFIENQKETLD